MAIPSAVGSVSISYSLSGVDSWLYAVPGSTLLNSQASKFKEKREERKKVKTIVRFLTFFEGQISLDANEEPSIAKGFVMRFYLSSPPPTSLIITPVGGGLTFSPASITFTSTTSSLEAVYTASACGAVDFALQVSGDDASLYDGSSFGYTSTITVACKSVSFDLPASFAANKPSFGRVYIDSPATATITPSAPGTLFCCVFTLLHSKTNNI